MQLYGLPPIDAPARLQAEQWASSYREPGMKRFMLQSNIYVQVAEALEENGTMTSSDVPADIVGFAGWMIPNQCKPLWPQRTLREKVSSFLYLVYDIFTMICIPSRVYAYFHPREAQVWQRRIKWMTIQEQGADKQVLPEHKESGYFHLTFMGVEEEHRRKGIATKLLQWGCDAADQFDMPIYLAATHEGVPFYLANGFEIILEESLLIDEIDGGYTETTMLRRNISERIEK